ncbi:MAG: hypothetical protein RL199_1283 [Pseudomonadota bacterium]|jgi:alanyl aminopeptidase
MRLSLLLAVLAACTHLRAAPPVPPPFGPLPRLVEPQRYALDLTVDPRAGRFEGRERIALRVAAGTASFHLHAKGPAIAALHVEAGGERIAASVTDAGAHDLVRIDLARPLPEGDAVLDLSWSAPFGTQAEGLFRVEQQGERYAFTQFESIYARRMFPCFDEPGFKTPFDVTLRVREGDAAVSNAPVAETRLLAGGWKEVRFETTRPLPTYLLALAVGPLDVVEGAAMPPTDVRPRAVPLRGVAVKGMGPRLAYALTHTRPLVEALEAKLGAYPYPKLDLIAVPGFAAGAMENAGAITFREWLLLIDDKTAPAEQKRAFAVVTAHELAHQWFGDLVTMRWWDDLWLNESFATWMEARAVAAVDPASRADLEALTSARWLMEADSLGATRRIRQPIATVHDIENAFDGITYEKGARVLSMFERWMGTDRFDAAVRGYLVRHADGHATGGDFLEALSREAGRDVSVPFAAFIDQPGVPVVKVEPQCDAEGAALTFRVSRWMPTGSSLDAKGHWPVPVCWTEGGVSGLRTRCELVEGTTRVTTPGACPDWVLPNAGSAGYFRFTLPDAAWRRLTAALPKLPVADRLSVLDSLTGAFAAGGIGAGAYLASLEAAASSGDRFVEGLAFDALQDLESRVLPEGDWSRVNARVAGQWSMKWALDGADAEQVLRERQRASFLLETAHDAKTTLQAAELGRTLLAGERAEVSPSLVPLALGAAVRAGGVEAVRTVAASLGRATDPDQRRRLLRALGQAEGEAAEVAREALLTDAVRGNELASSLGAMFDRASERPAAWRWLQKRFEAVVAKVPEEHVGELPRFGSDFCSSDDAQALQAFFEPRAGSLVGAPRSLAQAVEHVRLCVALRAHHQEALRAALAR